MKLTLDDLKAGILPSPEDEPKHEGRTLERPSYRREGLYGHTPFRIRSQPIIIALTIEQTCRACGTTSLSMGGLFCEQEEGPADAPVTSRNRIDYVEKLKIDKVINQQELVVYCPTCLGKGDNE